MTCATKTVILHLTWPETPIESVLHDSPASSTLASPTVAASSLSPSAGPVSRQRSVSGHSLLMEKNKKRPSLSLSSSSSSFSPGMSTPVKANSPLAGEYATPSPAASRRTSMLNSSTMSARPSLSPRVSSAASELSSAAARYAKELPVLDAVLETPEVSCGAVDPSKRRVLTSTRFSTRSGADRRVSCEPHALYCGSNPNNTLTRQMFVSTYDESRARPTLSDIAEKSDLDGGPPSPTSTSSTAISDSLPQPPTPTGPVVHDLSDRPPIADLTGIWSALADDASFGVGQGAEEMRRLGKGLPVPFKGLATPELNPMVCSSADTLMRCALTDNLVLLIRRRWL